MPRPKSLKTGDNAPEFSLSSSDGKEHSLGDFRGKKVVLFFYPKDMTSGCTKEACSFRDNYSAIRRKGAEIIGVSADGIASHQKFIRQHKLPFLLLSDEDKKTLKQYGVWKEKSLYGRKYMGIVRTTVIIDEKGKIANIFTKVRVDGHTEEVLAQL